MDGKLKPTGQTELVRTEFNPFVMRDGPRVSVDEAISINGIMARNNLVFCRPFIVLVDGEGWEQARWDESVSPGSEVAFIELPQGGGGSNPLRILALLAIMALSFWLGGIVGAAFGKIAGALVTGIVGYGGSMLVNYFLGATVVPETDDEGKSDFTAYSLSTGNNLSIGVPVPEHFGRLKFFPSLAQSLYTIYTDTGYMGEDNRWVHQYEQHLYMYGVIGVGEYTVHGVYIDKTPIDHYQDVDYNILPPGTAPSLCRRVAYVSNEVTGQELTENYVYYVVNPIGSTITQIQVDVMFPGGLCGWWKEKGDVFQHSVSLEVDYRLVDDDGNPVDEYQTGFRHTFSAATTTQLAFTCYIFVPASTYRYQVRVRRMPPKLNNPEDRSVVEAINFTALKSFGQFHEAQDDVTMIEIKMKASEQLSGNAANRIIVDATRRLYPVESTGFGASLANTRSPADALAYVVSSSNGGGQPDSAIDFATLYAYRTLWATEGYEFNYRFVSRISVMEACSKIARCARSIPFQPGGKFTVVMDRLQETPTQVYNESDFTEGSISITHKLRTDDDPTCVEVQYWDPKSMETKSLPLIYDSDGSELNPFTINLEGCTDRTQAWKLGWYMYLDDKLNRTVFEGITGLKGHIPSPGNKILVAFRQLDWGQSGVVMDIDGNKLWLSEPVDFGTDLTTGKILLSSATGGVLGPYDVEADIAEHCVLGNWTGLDIKTVHDDGEQATRFIFAQSVSEFLPLRLIRLIPENEAEVRIVGNIIHDEVYDDPGDPPGVDPPVIVSLLTDLDLVYTGVSGENYEFRLTWAGSAATVKIELDTGSGYTTLEDGYASHSYAFSTASETGTVRVTPYYEGALVPEEAMTSAYTIPPAPTGIEYTVTVDEWTSETTYHFTWPGTTGYEYSVTFEWDPGGLLDPVTYKMEGVWNALNSEWTCDLLLSNLGRSVDSFTATFVARKQNALSMPTEITVNVLGGAMPTGFALQQRLSTAVIVTWDDMEALQFVIYYSTTSGFAPNTEGILGYQGTMNSATIGGLNLTGSYEYYMRVAAITTRDQPRSVLNFSEELAILPEGNYEDVTDSDLETVTTNGFDPVQIQI